LVEVVDQQPQVLTVVAVAHPAEAIQPKVYQFRPIRVVVQDTVMMAAMVVSRQHLLVVAAVGQMARLDQAQPVALVALVNCSLILPLGDHLVTLAAAAVVEALQLEVLGDRAGVHLVALAVRVTQQQQILEVEPVAQGMAPI
jgi:hypothetical protein